MQCSDYSSQRTIFDGSDFGSSVYGDISNLRYETPGEPTWPDVRLTEEQIESPAACRFQAAHSGESTQGGARQDAVAPLAAWVTVR